MTDPTCACGCGRPIPDGYAAVICTERARQRLLQVAEMAQAAADLASGQSRNGVAAGSAGKPGSRLPIDLGATARFDAVQNTVTTWVRHVEEIRGIAAAPAEINAAGLSRLIAGPVCRTRYECAHTSCGPIRDPHPEADHPLAEAARTLAGYAEWIRHRPEVEEFLVDVEAAERVIRGLARGPGERKYLGPCGVPGWCCDRDDHAGHDNIPACEGDVYGRPGATTGRCQACGAQHNQAQRLDELAKLTEGRAYRAAHIADAHGLSVKTIRSWADRGKLRAWWFDGEQMHEWTEPDAELSEQERQAEIKARGPRLFVIADVLALKPKPAEMGA